jgi:hypothetical protein
VFVFLIVLLMVVFQLGEQNAEVLSHPESAFVRQFMSFASFHVVNKHMSHVCFSVPFDLLMFPPIVNECLL